MRNDSRFRRLFGVVVVVVVTLTLAGGALAQELPPGGTFTDDDGNVHEGYIEAIAAEGITQGCNPPDNTLYCPSDPVTRGQMAAFLVRALDLPASSEDSFTDDTGTTFEADINALSAEGITKGCNPPENDLYCPDDFVTRGQMAAFLVRAFGYTDGAGADLFTDDDGSTFEDDIDKLATEGVTLGCNPPTNDRYCPDDLVQRDQMASFLGRALGLDPIVPPPPPPPPPSDCDPSYPTVCIPSPPPDLDCGDITEENFTVTGSDPHGFDGDGNGIGCET